ncbi:HlyIII-domain-containing protein [Jaminaea rosea]|uniref:HlyIII-domain-containing protein n=1 Tax=Jaminaea rosea TaxID=1569628 RepID=A0A316UKT0_9BASI|nr:HlyIII-domain-containing protein [Jaminaea rosea]PWN25876.1 HlyIII-domain-containing protein [Jaminaea rosea]
MGLNTHLCSHEELPAWAKDNAFIVTGYRRPELFRHDTIAKCWASIWLYAHNESAHLLDHLGSLPSFLLPLAHARIFFPSSSSLNRTPTPSDWLDIAGFTTFLLAAVTCLTLSSTFHTLSCHSRQLAKRCNALDYVGIVVMIVGSFLPALHYGFHEHPKWQLFYGLGIVSLGGVAAWAVLTPHYATPEYRPVRTAIFLALGLSAVVPVAHGYILYDYATLRLTMGLDWLILSGSLYVVGALTYACRGPERFAPGRFDYVGASHQLFHCAIVGAAFAHYVCLRRAWAYWHGVGV